MKTVSGELIRLIEEFEGFKSHPYLCPAKVPTIGFGSTRYPNGLAITLADPPINREQGEEILRATLREYEAAVNRHVTVELSQNQFDALVDFAYNVGIQNLRTSTLLKLINQGHFARAADEFEKWIRGGGHVLPGLVKRREAERKLFMERV
jgi:lysozyme